VRDDVIAKEDPPGDYPFRIRRRPFKHVLASAMVATVPGEEYELSHSSIGQHKLTWRRPIKDPDGTVLPPGSLTPYIYPMCHLDIYGDHSAEEELEKGDDPKGSPKNRKFSDVQLPPEHVRPNEKQQKALKWLLLRVLADPQRVFYRRDASGAYFIHGLLIANTVSALDVVMACYAAAPRLLLQFHGPGPFTGEHGLHVLTVNRKEEELMEALVLAKKHLTHSQYHELLSMQTVGGFFRGKLTTFYGGSVLNFIAAFGLKRVLKQVVLSEVHEPAPGGSRLLDYTHACSITGFLPLHAAVANGRMDMYNLLTGGITSDGMRLPRELTVRPTLKGGVGSGNLWGRLSPLQLASKLGDKQMCKHILRDRLAIDWAWGPLASYRLGLDEIDSAGSEGNDVMEIISDFEAGKHTQELLLLRWHPSYYEYGM